MENPIINPSTLTEEQRKVIKAIYESDELILEDAELSLKWLLIGAMRRMERLFGKSMFEK